MNSKIEKFLRISKPASVEIIDSQSKAQGLKSILINEHGFRSIAYPQSLWGRSHPLDVARTEEVTFIVSDETLGPYINTLERQKAESEIVNLFESSMEGRVAYIVPYLMGPENSEYCRFGITVTDSPYVVLNMSILNKISPKALENQDSAVLGFHSIATMDVTKKRVVHFLDELEIYSVNTNYGGNVLTGKKCFALRVASYLGRSEGWLAEHMLISSFSVPSGEDFIILGGFPSACGKTNFAMLEPSEEYAKLGWRVKIVGDDIAWIFVKNGKLRAINPEYGFFGVAPGTSPLSNYNFWRTFTKGDSIFTNTALDLEKNIPWWEGCGEPIPEKLVSWKGEILTNPSLEQGPFAHPNSRITTPIYNCPVLHENWDAPDGHEVGAIIFGCRRSSGMPLVFEARSWDEGIYFAANLKSERTAAQEGAFGVLRHDPFAMRPFFSYHVGEYLKHWLEIGARLSKKPKIFFVNWFLKNANGKFVWPGFSDNLRVVEWIIKRCKGECDALEGLFGLYPKREDLNLPDQVSYEDLFHVDPHDFEEEILENGMFLRSLGSKCPRELNDIQNRLLSS